MSEGDKGKEVEKNVGFKWVGGKQKSVNLSETEGLFTNLQQNVFHLYPQV